MTHRLVHEDWCAEFKHFHSVCKSCKGNRGVLAHRGSCFAKMEIEEKVGGPQKVQGAILCVNTATERIIDLWSRATGYNYKDLRRATYKCKQGCHHSIC